MITKSLLDLSVSISSGLTPLRSNSEFWEKGTIPWLKTEQLGEKYIYETNEHISTKALDQTSIKIFPENSLSIAMYGEGKTRGNLSILRKPMATNQACCNVVVDHQKADFEYVYYFLKTQYEELRNLSSGVRKNLNSNDIKGYPIRLPEKLSEQKAIANVLKSLDDKIELNNRINAELEAMAKTLYDYWFVQFDFPDVNGKPYKASGGKMVYNDTLKREIPEGWSDKTLSQIANITMGQSPAGSSYNEEGTGTIFYQGSTDFGWLFPSTRQYTTAPSRMAKKGDILLSVRAPVGDMNIANTDCCIGRGLAALNSKAGSDGFLFYVMKYFKQIFDRRNSEGTTFGSITKNDLHSLTLAYPTADLLEKYDEVVTNYNKMIFERSLENRELVNLRDWLLPMLMNGQVTVKPSTESQETLHG
ncbi:restriction endonuclease subunit S [Shewanella algae]|uniref:Restriction endonuclease subunit S n=1 Tax=Shewanella algae TaxID=38313 RepID=A0A7T8EG69_9GAMM|nr:restriction endonuclease subunit S [Shewanella algae]MBO2698602.1 restriction endonuclease subunit S [Shewanella algae]QQO85728.1 restriction endonuclease subunit S [Shewanella algae]TVK96558.1 restriction endonuclease subunit S [Shewanella algae]BCV51746.1 type I restriction modification protein [Shewanella algae]